MVIKKTLYIFYNFMYYNISIFLKFLLNNCYKPCIDLELKNIQKGITFFLKKCNEWPTCIIIIKVSKVLELVKLHILYHMLIFKKIDYFITRFIIVTYFFFL